MGLWKTTVATTETSKEKASKNARLPVFSWEGTECILCNTCKDLGGAGHQLLFGRGLYTCLVTQLCVALDRACTYESHRTAENKESGFEWLRSALLPLISTMVMYPGWVLRKQAKASLLVSPWNGLNYTLFQLMSEGLASNQPCLGSDCDSSLWDTDRSSYTFNY